MNIHGRRRLVAEVKLAEKPYARELQRMRESGEPLAVMLGFIAEQEAKIAIANIEHRLRSYPVPTSDLERAQMNLRRRSGLRDR